jgi:hypothetical protein
VKRLTQKTAREYCRILGARVRRSAEWNEYTLVVDAPEGHAGEGPAIYHTNDLTDLIETARAILGSHPRIDEAEEFLKGETVVALHPRHLELSIKGTRERYAVTYARILADAADRAALKARIEAAHKLERTP